MAQMKGVILQNCPRCEIVDISHGVARHNIIEGSFLLETTVRYFPSRSIHVAVVDPGVGSNRLPIVVECRTGTLVGPNNGLLYRAANRLGFKGAYKIDTKRLRTSSVSATFHGRDIFAKTAAFLGNGASARSLGKRLAKIVPLKLPEPRMSTEGLTGMILHIDSFGNIITSIPNRLASSMLRPGQILRIRSGKRSWRSRFVGTYSDLRRGQLAVLLGSQDHLEIAAREENASEILGLKALNKLVVGSPSRLCRSGKSP